MRSSIHRVGWKESEPRQQCGFLSSLTLTLEGLLNQGLGRKTALCRAIYHSL